MGEDIHPNKNDKSGPLFSLRDLRVLPVVVNQEVSDSFYQHILISLGGARYQHAYELHITTASTKINPNSGQINSTSNDFK